MHYARHFTICVFQGHLTQLILIYLTRIFFLLFNCFFKLILSSKNKKEITVTSIYDYGDRNHYEHFNPKYMHVLDLVSMYKL